MRQVRFSTPATAKNLLTWLNTAMQQIALASNIDAMLIAQDYTVSNYTPTRTLNAGTATVADIANVLATLIGDLKAQGAQNG